MAFRKSLKENYLGNYEVVFFRSLEFWSGGRLFGPEVVCMVTGGLLGHLIRDKRRYVYDQDE